MSFKRDKQFLDFLTSKDEGVNLEFKASLQYDVENRSINKKLSYQVIKAMCSMMNSEGGQILVGFFEGNYKKDLPEEYIGIEKDNRRNNDQWQNFLNDKIKEFILKDVSRSWDVKFRKYKKDLTCAVIEVEESEELIPCIYADENLNVDKNHRVYWVRQPGRVNVLQAPDVESYQLARISKRKNKKIQQGWNFDPNITLFPALKKDWKGGFVYREFNKHKVPSKKGIYILVAEEVNAEEPLNQLKTILYVGKANGTSGFYERYVSHLTEKDFELAINKYSVNLKFWYKTIRDEDMLDDITFYEKNLIDVFGPSINQIEPPKSGIRFKGVSRGRDG